MLLDPHLRSDTGGAAIAAPPQPSGPPDLSAEVAALETLDVQGLRLARAITGTNWNGPRFFGLRDKPKPARSTPAPEQASP